jgi:BON domain
MRSYDRPYSLHPERWRDRDRDLREREFREFPPRSRHGHFRDDDDDDRGPWISRDRDEFDPRENREHRFARDRRFEQFEEWERPLQMRELYGGTEHSPQYGVGRYGYAPGRSGHGFGYGASRFEREGSYAGRGPKGYRRSDERIQEEVCERLTAAPDIDATDVEVSVQNGEVTLDGTIRERSMKRAAEDCAESVTGVQQVHNRLRIEAGEDERRGASGQFGSRDQGQRSEAERRAH